MNRTENLTIRLTLKERQILQERADKSNRKITTYIRETSLGKTLHEKPPDEFFKALWDLDKIGTNLNQVAIKVNTYNYLDEKELKRIILELDNITKELRRKYIGSG